MPNRETVLKAADRLEDLGVELKNVIQEMRGGTGDPYKMTYELRREIGRVVATLGAGVP